MSNTSPGAINEFKATAFTWAFKNLGGALTRLSDRSLLKLLAIARPLVKDPAAKSGLDEIIDAIRLGPPGTTLLRRLVRESTKEEVRDLFMGAVCNVKLDIEKL